MRRNVLDLKVLVTGAAVCFSAEVLLFFLGVAIGILNTNVGPGEFTGQNNKWLSVIYLGFTLATSFSIGGLIVGVLQGSLAVSLKVINGLGMWAISIAFMTCLLGGNFYRFAGPAVAAGATSSPATEILMHQIHELKPRIVSDIELTKGKIVSSFVVDKPPAPANTRSGEEMVETTKIVSLLTSVGILIAAIGGVAGSILGGKWGARLKLE